MTYEEARNNLLIDELAKIFNTQAKAETLLEDAGVDGSRIPGFGDKSAYLYWRGACRELGHGRHSDALRRLVRAAKNAYPANEVFLRVLQAEGIAEALDSPDEPLTDEEAKPVLAELATISSAALGRTTNSSDQELLEAIQAQVQELAAGASAKLKVALPILPFFVSIGLERDLGDLLEKLRRMLPERFQKRFPARPQ